MHLHIVRHGQTSWNAERRIQGQLESELDEPGIEQAKIRGADFVDMDLHAVYSSSSVRTRQTTDNILGTRDAFVTFRDDLREVKLGVWQGQLWADIERAYPEMVEAHWKALPTFNVEGAEKFRDVQRRGVSAIESIINAHKNAEPHENILVVSHGAIMKSILCHFARVPLTDMHSLPSLPNCAHCVIVIDDDKRSITHIAGEPFADTAWFNAARLETDNSLCASAPNNA